MYFPVTDSNNHRIFDKSGAGGGFSLVHRTDEKLRASMNVGGGVTIETASAVPNNTWIHYALTWSVVTDTLSLYLDGTPVLSTSTSGTLGTNDLDLEIGAKSGSNGGGDRVQAGTKLDQFRIHKTELTVDEVNALYLNEAPAVTLSDPANVQPTFTTPDGILDREIIFDLDVTDSNFNIDSDTVSVNVVQNNPPVAQDDSVTTTVNTPINIDVRADNGNGVDSDAEGDPLLLDSFDAVGINGGTIVRNDNVLIGDTSDDTLDFTPATNFRGVDVFDYTISDGNVADDIARLKFEDNLLDTSTSGGNDGTFVPTPSPPPPEYVDGNPGLGRALNVNSAFQVDLANEATFDFAETQPFSISAWFKTTVSTNQVIVAKSVALGTLSSGYAVYHDTTKLNFFILDGTGNLLRVSTGSPFNDGQWHHAVATYDGSGLESGMKLYVDGVLLGFTTSTTAITSGILNNDPFTIGAESDGDNKFPGQIDEVRVYSRAISQNEIEKLFNGSTDTAIVVNSDGTNPLTLVSSGTNKITDPQFSPDGSQIVFQEQIGAFRNVWKVNSDGSGLTQLTTDNQGEVPSFSPDGSKIAFQKNNKIAVMDPDGTNVQVLTSFSAAIDWVFWSPDGTEIWFTEFKFTGSPLNDIFKVNVATQVVTPITSDSIFFRDPSFYPDGSKILFTKAPISGATSTAVVSMNPDGTGQIELHTGNVGGASVSPDNTKIAFRLFDGDADLYVMNLDGTNPQEIFTTGVGGSINDPNWGTFPDTTPEADLSVTKSVLEDCQ